MDSELRNCRRCGTPIPPARLQALPDTLVCVECSEKIGGEFELEVKLGFTGKPGSLKKTGQEVTVRRKRRRLQ
jgi:Prokaryotic dksA/traR C4-type zinc finger